MTAYRSILRWAHFYSHNLICTNYCNDVILWVYVMVKVISSYNILHLLSSAQVVVFAVFPKRTI